MLVFSFITIGTLLFTSYIISLQSGFLSYEHIRLILFACSFMLFLFIIHKADAYFSTRKTSAKSTKKVENSCKAIDSRARYMRAKQISKDILDKSLCINHIEEARRE